MSYTFFAYALILGGVVCLRSHHPNVRRLGLVFLFFAIVPYILMHWYT